MGSQLATQTEVVPMNERRVLPGEFLYELLLEGFARGYNRRAETPHDYSAIMEYGRSYYLSLLPGKKCRVMRKQHRTWRTLKFPIFLHLYHFHKNGVKCERHVRIEFAKLIFDVPDFDFYEFPVIE